MITPRHIRRMDTRSKACSLVALGVCEWGKAFFWAEVAPGATAGAIYYALQRRIGK